MNCSMAEERDYNELYHLSNCKCRGSQWSYVVGDRIFGLRNYNIELFDVMAINTDRTKAFLLHVKNGIVADAFRSVCSQVKMCIEYLWNSLMAHSVDNVMERFYDVSTTTNNASIHRDLTSMEMKNTFKSKDEFLRTMICGKLQYYVCLAPCLSVKRKLKDLKECVLDFRFTSDVLSQDILVELEKSGILNPFTGRITPKFFIYASKEKFVQEIKVENAYEKIWKVLTGGTKTSLLKHSISFISKSLFVELYHEHQRFKVHGKTPIELRIVQIDRLEVSKVCNDDAYDAEKFDKSSTNAKQSLKRSGGTSKKTKKEVKKQKIAD